VDNFYRHKPNQGSGSIEIIIGVAVFALIAVSIYSAFLKVSEVLREARIKLLAASIANEQFEIIRNLPYADIGLKGGIPVGLLDRKKTIVRDGLNFEVTTSIRNIDDPFDGKLGQTPNDLSPADYKSVDLEIKCLNCANSKTLSFSTLAAPKNLETASTNGALFVRVFDANGNPVPGANVKVENSNIQPPILIEESTDANGWLQIVDAPPGVNSYHISVDKSNYSKEQTYAPGDPNNPNPINPHATVVVQQVTQTSFAIDRLSTFNIQSTDEMCHPISGVSFRLTGNKLIGQDPNIVKYNKYYSTDSAGRKVVSDIEWDSYTLNVEDPTYDLLGLNPIFPINISPNTTQNVQMILRPKLPNSLLVTTKDQASLLPLSGVSVKITKDTFEQNLVTGRGFVRQTDWSGGDGQEQVGDARKFYFSDGNIDTNNPAGDLSLAKQNNTEYASEGYLISSTFDIGSAGNIYQISWLPTNQPPETGVNSVKFQIATNNDNMTWNFLGPDGTDATFYTLSNSNINPIHSNSRYLRYKIFLSTENNLFSPSISDVSLTFTSNCVPSGQVLFSNLSSGTYSYTATKEGYASISGTVDISKPQNKLEIIMNPE
jgi:hypothetical protein